MKALKISLVSFFALVIFVSIFQLNDASKPINSEKSLSEKAAIEEKSLPIVIVPHFDFFAQKRNEFMADLAKKYKPKKVILFSVNHYSQGDYPVLSTSRQWELKERSLKVDESGYRLITQSALAEDGENVFLNEHGIKNILPDIAEYFPEAEVLPVVIKDSMTAQETDELFSKLLGYFSEDYMPIFSIDFSHYCPNSMAQLHDAFSIEALRTLEKDAAFKAETDSPQLMRAAVLWAKYTQREKFNLFYNSNSGAIENNDEIETTSVVLGHFEQGEKAVKNTSTFIFAGDIMMDRLVYHKFKNSGMIKIFENLGQRIFKGSDLSLANLEGPISQTPINDDVSSDNLVFNFPPETIDALKYLGVDAVSLANNHTQNAGNNGLIHTREILEKSDILPVGDPSDNFEENILRKDNLSIIALNSLSGEENIVEMIKSESDQGRFVIVFPHWGAEYADVHVNSQENSALNWIEAGADVIIGSHPHVIEDFTVEEGVPILYSLGNFVFDQTFSRETQEGLIVGMKMEGSKISLSFFPVSIEGQSPKLLRGERRREILEKLIEKDSEYYEVINSDTIKLK